ncbi:MAG: CheR family methyltransferase [Desulfobacterales bacterium]|jgi:chemotaxis protein methyltransferase CheR
MDDRQFKRLLDHLGYSFEGYRRVRKGVKKRLRGHMRELGCRDLRAYLERIDEARPVKEACTRRLAVPISRFMRDRPFWDALRNSWLPDLGRRFGPRLQAWCAGCACGEEAYSLAIIARESLGQQTPEAAPRLDIIATDLNPVCLQRARAGVYPVSSLREMPADLRARYLLALRGGRRFRVHPDLSKDITWYCRRIEVPLPEQRYHLIMLRNSVLTYYHPAGQTRILTRTVDSLHTGGLLVIGQRETLPQGGSGLKAPSPTLPFLFRKLSTPSAKPADVI